MKKLTILFIALFLFSCGQDRKVKVQSFIHGTEVVTVDFEPKKGQIIRVSDGVGYVYNPNDIIQHVGHVAQIIE